MFANIPWGAVVVLILAFLVLVFIFLFSMARVSAQSDEAAEREYLEVRQKPG